jgi:hypothetical protein
MDQSYQVQHPPERTKKSPGNCQGLKQKQQTNNQALLFYFELQVREVSRLVQLIGFGQGDGPQIYFPMARHVKDHQV